MNFEDDKQKTKRLSQLFSAAERDTAGPDEEFLDKLQEQSTAEFLASSANDTKDSQVKTPFLIWSNIMKSNITKLAAAAVIILACFIGLHFWKSTSSGIALADVLTRIEQVTGYMYQMYSIVTDQNKQGTESTTATILVSKETGLKMTITQVDSNNFQNPPHWRSFIVGQEWYLLPKSNSMVLIDHKQKEYNRFVFDDPTYSWYKEQYNEPREIIKQILSCEYKSLGRSVIDGITVEGFQTTDLAYEGGFFGQADTTNKPKKVDVKIWVDVNTFLPVRLEEDIITRRRDMRIQDVSYDFRWNVIINPDDFEPNIPEDYRSPSGDVILPAFNEENAIKGLKLFTDAFGKYPIDIKSSGREYEVNTKFDPNSYKDMSDEERTRKTSEILSYSAPGVFYSTLVKENKEPAYYGQTVKPGDANNVLLRWKLGDDHYRVIFGDLSAKTVNAKELAELEK